MWWDQFGLSRESSDASGLVDGDLPSSAADHIWMSRKASWMNLRELGTLAQHDGDPTEESNASLMAPLKLN
jgi:hypothetical protein